MYFHPSVFRCILLRWVRLLGFAVMYGTVILKLYRYCALQLSESKDSAYEIRHVLYVGPKKPFPPPYSLLPSPLFLFPFPSFSPHLFLSLLLLLFLSSHLLVFLSPLLSFLSVSLTPHLYSSHFLPYVVLSPPFFSNHPIFSPLLSCPLQVSSLLLSSHISSLLSR